LGVVADHLREEEESMKGRRVLAVVVVAVLGVALFGGSQALAGKKKKTTPVFFSGSPKFSASGNVNSKGTLNTASACKPNRSVRLQAVDVNGNVLATLDGDTTDTSGNWQLVGQLPNTLPAGTNYVRVKVNKRTAGKFVCKAGVSQLVAIPAK
jgi:hypothetical protein